MLMRCSFYIVVSLICTLTMLACDHPKAIKCRDLRACDALTELRQHLKAKGIVQLTLSYIGNGKKTIDLKEFWRQKNQPIPTFGIVLMTQHKTLPNTIILQAHFLEFLRGKKNPHLEQGTFTYDYITDSLKHEKMTAYNNHSVKNSKGLRAVLPKLIIWTAEIGRTIIEPEASQIRNQFWVHTVLQITQPDSPEYRLHAGYLPETKTL